MDSPLRSWGITWTRGIRHSVDHDCQNCNQWSYRPSIHNPQDWNQIVGFDHAPERGTIIGKLIVECPVCGEKMWWHTRVAPVDLCKAWPKS